MKKALISVLAVFLCLVTAFIVPVQAVGESKPVYISDVKIAVGKDGREKLQEAGYTPIDEKMDSDEYVYIGYKTSDNKEDAITDMSVMNMTGGFAYDKYDELLKEQKAQIAEFTNSLVPAIEEFKTNLSKNTARAKYAYNCLDLLYEDDTNMYMGKFLKTKTTDDIANVLLQCNGTVVSIIESYLGVACTDKWVERFIAGFDEDVYDETTDENAYKLLDLLPDFQNGIKEYNSFPIKYTDDDIFAVREFIDSLSDSQYYVFRTYGAICEYLQATSYGEGTLYDFFTQDLEEMAIEDLYPMAQAMTPGQLATIGVFGIANSMCYSISSDKTVNASYEALELDSFRHCSVYSGVDRSLYDADGIALTDEAQREIAAGGTEMKYGRELPDAARYTIYGLIGVCSLVGVGAAIYAFSTLGIAEAAATSAAAAFDTMSGAALTAEELSRYSAMFVEGSARALQTSSAVSVASCIAIVAIIVVLALVAFLLVWEALRYAERKVDYTKIPRVLVDEKTDENGRQLTYYYAVTNLKGECADLNNFKGQEWNALYYTKDPDAGKPITEGYLLNNSLDTPVDGDVYRPVHSFGSTAVYNLNAYNYKKCDPIYLYFKYDSGVTEDTTTAATAISATAGYALAAVGGFVIGIGAAVLTLKLKKKKVTE